MNPPVDAPASRAGRCRHRHGEAGQGGIELLAAAAHEGRRRPEQDDRLIGGHEPRRLLGGCAGDEHAAGGDDRLRLLPGGDEAPAHELGVEPAAGPGGQLAAFLAAVVFLAAAGFVGSDVVFSELAVRLLRFGLLALGLLLALAAPLGQGALGRLTGPLRRLLGPGPGVLARLAGPLRGVLARLGGAARGVLARLGGSLGRPLGGLGGVLGGVLGRLGGVLGGVLGRLAGVLGGAAAGLRRALQDVGHLVGDLLERRRVDPLELVRHLAAHRVDQGFTRLAALLNHVVHPFLCLAARNFAGVHQFSHDLLGPAPCDLTEDGARIEVLAYPLVACH